MSKRDAWNRLFGNNKQKRAKVSVADWVSTADASNASSSSAPPPADASNTSSSSVPHPADTSNTSSSSAQHVNNDDVDDGLSQIKISKVRSCASTQAFSVDAPNRPILKKYPVKTSISAPKQRSFSSRWYNLYDWLEYYLHLDAAFCFPCRIYGNDTKEYAFTVNGFTGWSHASEKNRCFQKHQKSQDHIKAHSTWLKRQSIPEGADTSIIRKLVPEMEKLAEDNLAYFELLF